ncbi:hypothetical protein pb186bvf_014447 [Paramecium bursaria]
MKIRQSKCIYFFLLILQIISFKIHLILYYNWKIYENNIRNIYLEGNLLSQSINIRYQEAKSNQIFPIQFYFNIIPHFTDLMGICFLVENTQIQITQVNSLINCTWIQKFQSLVKIKVEEICSLKNDKNQLICEQKPQNNIEIEDCSKGIVADQIQQ